MTEALAVAAILLSLVALGVAARAVKGAGKAVGADPSGGGAHRGDSFPAPVPPSGDSLPPPMPETDPSVLVRLDALESRQETLEIRATKASGTVPSSPPREREDEPKTAGRRIHPMFP